MKFRLLATIIAVFASAHTARAQAMFPPETDNAALRYWFALAEVREPPDDDATWHLFGETIAGRVAWDEKKLGPILDSNLDALRTMQRATKLPICHWGFDYRNGARTPVWFLMRAGLLSHLNELQGIREMAQGDSRTAVDTWLAGVHFGQDMSRSGPVIAALVAHAIILDNLHPLRDSARQEKLNEEQKTELSVVVKTMPEDGFDWGAAWGVEFAIGDQFLQKSRTAGKPESDDKIHAYEEYMLAAQAALREPPAEAKSRIADLESKLRRLGKVEQNLIPGLRVTNEARIRLATAHQELMQALSAK
ncbi:MAG: hypothetical protein DMG33_01130 [Acidobacteria bacterium]|nr:MAG: hypothetical protein DMG33_01130 [Acidobacteriota bacterium]